MFIIFGLKSMIKQLFDLVYGFPHLKCIIKQLLDSVFVICKIINVSVRVISLAFGLTLTSTLIILHITKTSSNNCLLLYIAIVLCVVIGQLHADKYDYHTICR